MSAGREGPALWREAALFICHHVTGVETGVSFHVLQTFFSFIYLFASIRSSQIELFLPPVASAEWVTAPGDAEGGEKLVGVADRRTYIVRWHSSAQKVTIASFSKAGFPLLRKTGNWGELMTPCEVWNVQAILWHWCILILSFAFHKRSFSLVCRLRSVSHLKNI